LRPRKQNVKKRAGVVVFPAPALDQKSQLSLIYEQLGNIQTMKVEFAVLPTATRYDHRRWMCELLIEEFKLVREAAYLEGHRKDDRHRKAVRPGSRVLINKPALKSVVCTKS
jgi:hypothetical protein